MSARIAGWFFSIFMNLISRITEEISKVKKNGEIPDMIWLGREERRDLEALGKDTCVKVDKECKRWQVMGLDVGFVSENNWLSVSKVITMTKEK